MMQDPASAAAAFPAIKPQFPEQEQHLKCPRCDSTNTKFCYYNNYNLSQPRHFCKSCRRYWTKGGALRNIPVGGGTRKNSKRSTSTSADTNDAPAPASTTPSKRLAPSSSATTSPVPDHLSPFHPRKLESLGTAYPMPHLPYAGDQPPQVVDVGGGFSPLLPTNGHSMSLLEGLHHHGGALGTFTLPNSIASSAPDPSNSPPPPSNNFWTNDSDGDAGNAAAGGWPDLSIYTPGSRFP